MAASLANGIANVAAALAFARRCIAVAAWQSGGIANAHSMAAAHQNKRGGAYGIAQRRRSARRAANSGSNGVAPACNARSAHNSGGARPLQARSNEQRQSRGENGAALNSARAITRWRIKTTARQITAPSRQRASCRRRSVSRQAKSAKQNQRSAWRLGAYHRDASAWRRRLASLAAAAAALALVARLRAGNRRHENNRNRR